MKFLLTHTESIYAAKDAKRLEKLGFQSLPFGAGKMRLLSNLEGVSVEIGSLEELIKFAGTYGKLIITREPPGIEIYDGYRE